MRKRKIITLTAAAVCAGALLLAGCGSDEVTSSTSAAAEETGELSAEEEEAETESYIISLTSRWYDAEGTSIGNATIEIYNGDQMVYTGTTSATGSLATCAFPSGTKLKFCVISEDGTTLAESYLLYAVSDEYDEIEISPLSSEDTMQTIGLPTDSTSVDSALYINENGVIETANITMNRENEGASTSEEETEENSEESSEDTTAE